MDWAINGSTWWTAVGSAFAIGLLLGAVPSGPTEAIALAAGALPPDLSVAVIVALTAGHIGGKMVWYWLGTLEARVTWPRVRAWIDRARALAAGHPTIGLGVVAASAVASLPPFHLTAIAAGIVHSPPLRFFAVAFAGRLIRFGALALFPWVVRYLWQVA